MMILHAFTIGSRMCQMKYNTGSLGRSPESDHLRNASFIDTDAMPHQRLVVAARALPELFAGKAEFTSAKWVIGTHTPIAETIDRVDARFTALAPGDVDTLSGPDNFWRQIGRKDL